MKCSSIKGLLSEYMDGLLDPEQEEAVKGHLLICRRCSEDLASLKKVTKALASFEQVKAPDDFLAQIHNRIEKGPWWKDLLKTLFVPVKIKIPLECLGLLVTAVLVSFIFRELRLTPELRHTLPPPASQQAPQIGQKAPKVEIDIDTTTPPKEKVPSSIVGKSRVKKESTEKKSTLRVSRSPQAPYDREVIEPSPFPDKELPKAQGTLPEEGAASFDESKHIDGAIDMAGSPFRSRSRLTLTPSPPSETQPQIETHAPLIPTSPEAVLEEIELTLKAPLAKKGYHPETPKGEYIGQRGIPPEKEGAEGISYLISIIEKVGGVYLSSESDMADHNIISVLADIPANQYNELLKELRGLGTLEAPSLPHGFSETESEKNIRIKLHLSQIQP